MVKDKDDVRRAQYERARVIIKVIRHIHLTHISLRRQKAASVQQQQQRAALFPLTFANRERTSFHF
jgi:hypothetical protein